MQTRVCQLLVRLLLLLILQSVLRLIPTTTGTTTTTLSTTNANSGNAFLHAYLIDFSYCNCHCASPFRECNQSFEKGLQLVASTVNEKWSIEYPRLWVPT